MQKQVVNWQLFDNPEAIRQAACQAIVKDAAEAISLRGRYSIVLAGGSTPRDVYRLLRDAQTDWSKWHVFYGDERCLPLEHADRNSRMAQEAWLNHVNIPADQIHPIPAELGPQAGAAAYASTLAPEGEFDLVLLGLGEDAHTASLFPGHVWDDAGAAAIPVFDAPKPPPERVSISASRLSRARRVIYLVTGAGKRAAVQQWRAGEHIPAAAITPQTGVEVWLDQAAAN